MLVLAVLVSLDVILILSSETPTQKENYDPFLVKSPHPPSCGDHVVTMPVPKSSSYSIEVWNSSPKVSLLVLNLEFLVQICPGSSDEIEVIFFLQPSAIGSLNLPSQEIMVISPKKSLPRISTLVI